MAVGPKIAVATVLEDLNLAVQNGIAIREKEILADFNFTLAKVPKFLAIWY